MGRRHEKRSEGLKRSERDEQKLHLIKRDANNIVLKIRNVKASYK